MAVPPAAAQQIDDQMRERLHKATARIWFGAALIAGGALVVPVTATRSDGRVNGSATIVGLGAMGLGTGLVWSGFQARRRTVHPQTDFGIVLGRRNGVIVRRVW